MDESESLKSSRAKCLRPRHANADLAIVHTAADCASVRSAATGGPSLSCDLECGNAKCTNAGSSLRAKNRWSGGSDARYETLDEHVAVILALECGDAPG